jgi:hypothetical protein
MGHLHAHESLGILIWDAMPVSRTQAVSECSAVLQGPIVATCLQMPDMLLRLVPRCHKLPYNHGIVMVCLNLPSCASELTVDHSDHVSNDVI